MKIRDVLENIMDLFPDEWLSDYYLDDHSADIDVKDPSQNTTYLNVLIMNNHVGIAIMKESERNIDFDLSGFDYNIEISDKKTIEKFFIAYRETGIPPTL